MDRLLSNFKIEVPKGIYIKDPETSDLGKRIVGNSIELISDIGFEQFNFKKLGLKIGSNESSIYRYFESKHHLLMYLTSWYWVWIEYQLVIETFALKNTKEKLLKGIEVVTRTIKTDSKFSHINEVLLNQNIINENSKVYLTKKVDSENKDGFFFPFKRVVKRIAEIISEHNSTYKHPLSLANTVIEGALQQHFFKQHFTTITNCNKQISVTEFYTDLILKILCNEK
ncbi:TetR family transcriptional regulator [Tenacibaculum holothuriorum]|uniref:TetR family transcriptional regulator n=1 Tax=Tenacibaculum holothuriorum TaxID=1635173 RepID=A0A1Y2PDI9_9FLAO|nr:TetR/AcrR family transcriptional regulator [Tenacibaculum holothuriorum]OSY88556.1 TetR family transcriptional regulator [Tenacibaculum holothuriorum]